MESHPRVPSRPIVHRRPRAVSTSLLSTPALDVDLHVVLARPRPNAVVATTFVRVSFHEERVVVELAVSERPVEGDADASVLAVAQARALRRTPAACRAFVRQAISVATAVCPN